MADAHDILRLARLSSTALARMPAAITALARALDDPRPEIRDAARATLERMVQRHRLRPQHLTHGFPAQARAALLDHLARAPCAAVRRLAAEALREAEQVQALPGFLDGLSDMDAGVRDACARALDRVRMGPAHAPRLAALLDHERTATRRAALHVLAAHAYRDLLSALAPALRRCLAHPDPGARQPAALLLARLPEPPGEVWPVLAEAIAAPAHAQAGAGASADVQRATALQRLAALGDRARPFIPAVLAAAADPAPAVRSHAITALAALAAPAAAVIDPVDPRVDQALTAALADPASPVRRAAVQALARQPADAPALAALPALARDPGAPVPARTAAIEALAGARTAAAIPVLAALLADRASEIVDAAIEALGRLGATSPAAARMAAPALEPLLQRPALRVPAAAALVTMGASSPALRPALEQAARAGSDRDPDDWHRELARALLAELAEPPEAT